MMAEGEDHSSEVDREATTQRLLELSEAVKKLGRVSCSGKEQESRVDTI